VFECGAAGFEVRDFGGRGVGMDGFGVEAMAAAVAGGLAFAGGGDRSAGSGAVAAGCFALFFRSHAALVCMTAGRIGVWILGFVFSLFGLADKNKCDWVLAGLRIYSTLGR